MFQFIDYNYTNFKFTNLYKFKKMHRLICIFSMMNHSSFKQLKEDSSKYHNTNYNLDSSPYIFLLYTCSFFQYISILTFTAVILCCTNQTTYFTRLTIIIFWIDVFTRWAGAFMSCCIKSVCLGTHCACF